MTALNSDLSVALQLLSDQFDWTLEMYHEMIQAGVLTKDHRVELIGGKIVNMSPIGWLHSACISELSDYFYPRLSNQFRLRFENPVTLNNNSEPEPDFIVAKQKANKYADGHPTAEDIIIICEVSDYTLKKDKEVKTILYAEAGIKEYWIINLFERQLIQMTEPETSKGTYGSIVTHAESSVFEHPVIGTIKVAELLPAAR